MPQTCTDITERLRKYTGSSQNSAWTVQESALGGRGLFASKPIKKGSLIFTNKPLVIGARADSSTSIHCSNCYQSDSCVPCEKCQLLICSDMCKQSQEHSKECNYIASTLVPKVRNEENCFIFARVLIYFRFLLLSVNEQAVVNLLQRGQSHSSFEELDALCSKYYVPEEEIQKIKVINTILKINSFRVAKSSCEKKIPIRGLYPLSAFLNHSCLPNTRNVFLKDHTMAVYATQNIDVGEELLSCYTGLLWCTPARRYQLYKTKSFWCKCERCKDPTEKGTRLSALKCSDKNCIGVILPTDPLACDTTWCCDICCNMTPPERVNIIQSVLGSLVGTLQLDDKFNLENAVLDRLASFVPYSNHIFVDIRLRLAFKLGSNDGRRLNGIIKK
ncbi:SET domain-containing protein SmydA-8-like [Epargyreus clarus]|uniref:SET domain-containing protein SmydA-8-like n=1 Tax=Epargyreus clarus TaxID=520877 RepID=UPI003C2B39AA